MICEDTDKTKICASGWNDRICTGNMQCESLDEGVYTLLILTAAAGTRYRKSAVILTVIWLGFCVGMVICTAIARLGIKGIVLCVIAVMPQGVFYILSGILLFEYMLEYPVVRWNSGKTIKLIMLVLLGMITECYVNPVIIRMFLKTL